MALQTKFRIANFGTEQREERTVKQNAAEIEIYDGRERRKYLTDKERKQFRASAARFPPTCVGFV